MTGYSKVFDLAPGIKGGSVLVMQPSNKGDDQKIILSPDDLRQLLWHSADEASKPYFRLMGSFNPDNIVEIAKSQFPRLEAQVAIHTERELTRRAMRQEMERTKRLLIVVAGCCLVAGAALIVFAPTGKEGVSYVVAAALTILSLGAIGVQEFRIQTIGVTIDGGSKALTQTRNDRAVSKSARSKTETQNM